jgi:HlyD family secretion protein
MPPDAQTETPQAQPMKAAPEPAQPPPEPPREAGKNRSSASTWIPSIIVGLVAAAVVCLSIWYLVRPEPLLVQGEVDATRLDIAARVDGRVGDIPVVRGEDVAAGAVLVRIDNPETLAKHEQALAAKVVAEAQLANINVGTRPEVIAARKAALERARASVVLAKKTYDRISQLAEHGNAPQARLDQATDALHESERGTDQAKSAYEQAVNGYTREEHEIAEANVGKAIADIKAVQSIVDQMVVYAPVASQVYKRNVEPGEYVSPGVPLITLVDLGDMWVHFDLREDLVRTLKIGDRFDVRIPALTDRRITVEVRLIATKGEYASWRATRATGDFDLRTFSIRAYPVEKVPELRPGMSAYLDVRARARR